MRNRKPTDPLVFSALSTKLFLIKGEGPLVPIGYLRTPDRVKFTRVHETFHTAEQRMRVNCRIELDEAITGQT